MVKHISSTIDELAAWRKTILSDTFDRSERIIMAELARYAFIATCGADGRKTASIAKLFSYMRPRLQFRKPEAILDNVEDRTSRTRELNQTIREILDDLDAIGDISELTQGSWIPAPSRYVRIDSAVAVLSSLPTPYLQSFTGINFSSRGLLRFASADHIPQLEAAGFFEQEIEDWVGRSVSDLTSILREIESLDDANFESQIFEPFEVYAPWLTSKRRQRYRWVSNAELKVVPDGLQLCRAQFRKNGRMRTWLGRLSQRGEEILATSELPITQSFSLKVQFALDQKFGAENVCLLSRTDEYFDLTTDIKFPFEIFRLLSSLSFDISLNQNWHRTFSIELPLFPAVLERLKLLSVKVNEV